MEYGQSERTLFGFEKAGNQYLGRLVTGINCNEASFATSPSYFAFRGCDDLKK